MLAQQSHAQPDVKRTRRLVRKIINWATEDDIMTKDRSRLEDLTRRLASEVVDEAVKLSLDLRRQYRICRIRFPSETHAIFTPTAQVAAALSSPADPKSSQGASEAGTIKIFPKPCLEKGEWLHIDQDSVVLVESECVQFPASRIPLNSNRGTGFVRKHFASKDSSETCVTM
jgi:hypothetical protein